MSHSGESVDFHSASIAFSLQRPAEIRRWIIDAANEEGRDLHSLSYVFCSDDYLLEVNRKHLDHDFYTDVITFDYSEDDALFGEVYVSVDRVGENANQFDMAFEDELHRVMIHGFLHLCGYGDSSDEEKRDMTRKEDYYLSLRTFL